MEQNKEKKQLNFNNWFEVDIFLSNEPSRDSTKDKDISDKLSVFQSMTPPKNVNDITTLNTIKSVKEIAEEPFFKDMQRTLSIIHGPVKAKRIIENYIEYQLDEIEDQKRIIKETEDLPPSLTPRKEYLTSNKRPILDCIRRPAKKMREIDE